MEPYFDKALELRGPHKISCIIPAWNEEKNIHRVLDVVQKTTLFDEVIVVDDGSADNTSNVVRKYNVTLLIHPENKGKAAAVLTGINHAQGDLIVTLDADLLGLTEENIAKMIYFVLLEGHDMTILDRAGDRKAIWGWTNCARFFGGERTFWKKDFDQIDIPTGSGYLIEIIMNLYYIKNNKKIRNIYCKNLYTIHQFHKFGFFQGYYNYIKVGIKIVRKATIKGFLQQVSAIEDDHKYYLKIRRLQRAFNYKISGVKERMHFKQQLQELQEKFSLEKYQKLRERIYWPDEWGYQNLKAQTTIKLQDFKNYVTKMLRQ